MLEGMPDSSKKRPFDKELKFNDNRWAKQEASRGFLSRKTKVDFMREEAERDNEYYKKKLHVEYGKWEAKSAVVRGQFLERMRNPERTDIVTARIFMPGGMKADGMAGSALGMDVMGMDPNVIDYNIGGSSGDVVATRATGGRDQLLRGIAMLEGPLCDKKFIDPLRRGNMINLAYLKELEDKGEYAIDEEAIRNAHSKLWTLVTEPIKGNEKPRVKILDKKAIKEGITTGTVATMSIPGVTGKPLEIDGVEYSDSAFGALPIKEIIEKIKLENPGATINVLIFMQTPFEPLEEMKPMPQEEIAAKIMRAAAAPLGALGSLDAKRNIEHLAKVLVMKEKQRESVKAVEEETGAKIGFVFAPPSSLTTTSTDSDEMKMAKSQAFRNIIDQFGGEQPDEIPEYIPEKERSVRATKDLQDAA